MQSCCICLLTLVPSLSGSITNLDECKSACETCKGGSWRCGQFDAGSGANNTAGGKCQCSSDNCQNTWDTLCTSAGMAAEPAVLGLLLAAASAALMAVPHL